MPPKTSFSKGIPPLPTGEPLLLPPPPRVDDVVKVFDEDDVAGPEEEEVLLLLLPSLSNFTSDMCEPGRRSVCLPAEGSSTKTKRFDSSIRKNFLLLPVVLVPAVEEVVLEAAENEVVELLLLLAGGVVFPSPRPKELLDFILVKLPPELDEGRATLVRLVLMGRLIPPAAKRFSRLPGCGGR